MTGPAPGFVEFVEERPPDLAALGRALAPAVAANRYANFGPVSAALEARLLALNGANPARAACAAASGTLALQAIVSTFENALGRRLRWAVGDFGFFTNFIGPFHGQRHLPCGPDGLLGAAALSALPDDAYDGILATNVFGLAEDFDALFDHARARRKVLVFDNAAGFGALAPRHAAAGGPGDGPLWAEIVSLHQTKPWGMGEGGAAFLPADLAGTFRAAINFGAGGGDLLGDLRLCGNGKMSEIAAAQILTRVETHDRWAPGYRAQAERLTALGRDAGLRPVFPAPPARAVPGQVALVSPDRPVPLDRLENPRFRILKYYRPGPPSGLGARSLYDHVLNLPCHPGMAALSDADIVGVLRQVTGAS